MNTKSNSRANEIKARFDELLSFENENEEIEHDAYILMSGFLSEIENIQKKSKMSRKKLAEKIGTSASYLTQVFRNDKPLNFYTLAKISKALDIKFEINAISKLNAHRENLQSNGKSRLSDFENSQSDGNFDEGLDAVSPTHAEGKQYF